jgi:tetratricopeptide (TPR) repeat protein
MDWGVAKLLAPGAAAAQEPAAGTAIPCGTVIKTSRQSDSSTVTGCMLGTPSFMAPEQAGGELHRLDERTDVFGLGAILCVILTGEPPYTGKSGEEVRARAILGALADAHGRLEQCGADAKLVELCRACLSAYQDGRPPDAGAVAAAVRSYLAGVEERARQAETERAEAVVREAEQRKRRRTVQVAAGVFAVVLLAGLSVSLWQMFRAQGAEGLAKQNAQKAREERDAKDEALKAEQQARADETKTRQQAFAALRSMTDDVVEKKFAQGAVLTEEDRAFLRGIIAQIDAFAAIKGDDADSRAARAEGRWRVGLVRSRLGELKEAEQDYEQALNTYQKLVADFPDRTVFRQALATIHNHRGILLRDTERLKEAEQDYELALSIQKQLAARFPNRAEFRQQLASSHLNRGALLHTTRRLKAAKNDYDQALSIQKELSAQFPARPEFRQDLATSHHNRGNLLSAMGRPKEAEQDYDQSLSIYKQLSAQLPSRPEFRQGLASSHLSRGALLYNTRRLKAAKNDYDQALSIQKELSAQFPSCPEFRQDLAASHNNRGNLLATTGRPKEAEQDFDQALSIHKQLAADFPFRPQFRQDLATSHHNRGNLLSAMGRLEAAEQDYGQAVSIYKQLASDFTARLDFRQKLAGSHNSRGLLLHAAGRLQEAEKDHDQALSILKQLSAHFPGQPDLWNDLAGTCVNLAILRQRQGDGAAAKRLLLEGRPHHLVALKANPRHPSYRQFYRNHLSVLTQVHAGLLEQEDAVRTAKTRRDLGWNAPADAYDAACFLSLSIPIVANHPKLDDKQRKEAERFYGDAAMKLLRDAVSKGFKNVPHMKKDTDLNPLRQREDFQKLVAQLEGKGK